MTFNNKGEIMKGLVKIFTFIFIMFIFVCCTQPENFEDIETIDGGNQSGDKGTAVLSPIGLPVSGTYIFNVENEIKLFTTNGFEIRYTMDGTEPDEESPIFKFPIIIKEPGDYIIKAKSYGNGESSSVTVLTYKFTPAYVVELNSPVIETPAGEYDIDTFEGVVITDDQDAEIRYTIDGTEPTVESNLYENPIIFKTASNYTVKAKVFKDGKTSETISVLFTINDPSNPNIVYTPVFSKESGEYNLSEFAFSLSSTQEGVDIRYTINSDLLDELSTLYTDPISFNEGGTYTVIAKAFKNGYSSDSVSAVYAIIDDGEAILMEVNILYGGITELEIGETGRLTGEAVYSDNSKVQDVTWESTDESVVSITYDGSVEGLKAGTSTIYAVKGEMKSDPCEITVIDNSYDGLRIYYKSTSGTPTIWAWEDANPSGNEGDIPITTGSWPGPSMSSVDGVDNWYIFEVPAAELTDGMPYDIKIIFNASGEHTYDSTKQWYDGSKWYSDNPDGPQPPVVSATPSGGIKDAGTYNVTLSVEGENVISAKYSIDGSNPATSGTTFTDGDTIEITLAIDQIITLKLWAENSEGTTVKTYTFTEGEAPDSVFSWDNASVYFVITDRFKNGDEANDNSYGRELDQNGNPIPGTNYKASPATFHGGDLKGLKSKVDDNYFTDLGVNAIWLTAPYEQIHGWVGGGESGRDKHYGYHGYYTLDYTEIDANMGTALDFEAFVDACHAKEIRVVLDVVINHLGYESITDMAEFGFGELQGDWENYLYSATDGNAGYDDYKGYINWSSTNWTEWWGPDWIRKDDIGGGYDPMGSSPYGQYNFNLPDVKTESTKEVGLPPVLATKWGGPGSEKYDQEMAELDAFFTRTGKARTPRNYIIKWLTDYIREYGVDGFRLDTVNNLDRETVGDLSTTAKSEYEWTKANNPEKIIDPSINFWMTGEAYDHGVDKDWLFYEGNLDSAINFDFPKDGNLGSIGDTWAEYAGKINNDDSFNVLSYLSSHDKGLSGRGNMINAGTTLLLSPGAIQIFYGDENERADGGGGEHGWRSDYQWGANPHILAHWQKVGRFRRDHIAVGAGSHGNLGNNTYSRIYSKNGIEDKVVIKIMSNGTETVSVSGVFADGTTLRDAYTGDTAVVTDSSVTFIDGGNGVILIEEVK